MEKVVFLGNEPFAADMGSTNRQRLARAASKSGWTVSYIETIGWKVKKPTSRTDSGVSVEALWNLSPYAGKSTMRLSRSINRTLSLRGSLRGVLDDADLVVNFDPLFDLPPDVTDGRVIYDCLDAYETQPQFARSSRSRKLLLASESRVANRSSARTATSRTLAESKCRQWGGIDVITLHGAFEPWGSSQDMHQRYDVGRSITSRKALVVSALDEYKVDLQYLSKLANANPAWQFAVYGKAIWGITQRIRDYLALPNVGYFGPRSFEKIGQENPDAAVGIISMSASKYSEYSFPLKSWDYLALGLPVVALNAVALKNIAGIHHVSNEAVALDQIANESNFDGHSLIDLAYKNTSACRWERLRRL
jgi:hypothetical protein